MLIGDRLEKIFEKTGIKALVDMITDDCGCQDRKDALNKFHAKWLAGRGRNNHHHLNTIADAYEAVTGHKVSPKARRSQCPACWQRRIQAIIESPEYQEALSQANGKLELTEALKQTVDTSELNLKQLRAMYPGVKANSKAKFLSIINAE